MVAAAQARDGGEAAAVAGAGPGIAEGERLARGEEAILERVREHAAGAGVPDFAAGGIDDEELVRLAGGEADLHGAVVEIRDVERELHAVAHGDAGGDGEGVVIGGRHDHTGVFLIGVVLVRSAWPAREDERGGGGEEEERTIEGTGHVRPPEMQRRKMMTRRGTAKLALFGRAVKFGVTVSVCGVVGCWRGLFATGCG